MYNNKAKAIIEYNKIINTNYTSLYICTNSSRIDKKIRILA